MERYRTLKPVDRVPVVFLCVFCDKQDLCSASGMGVAAPSAKWNGMNTTFSLIVRTTLAVVLISPLRETH